MNYFHLTSARYLVLISVAKLGTWGGNFCHFHNIIWNINIWKGAIMGSTETSVKPALYLGNIWLIIEI